MSQALTFDPVEIIKIHETKSRGNNIAIVVFLKAGNFLGAETRTITVNAIQRGTDGTDLIQGRNGLIFSIPSEMCSKLIEDMQFLYALMTDDVNLDAVPNAQRYNWQTRRLDELRHYDNDLVIFQNLPYIDVKIPPELLKVNKTTIYRHLPLNLAEHGIISFEQLIVDHLKSKEVVAQFGILNTNHTFIHIDWERMVIRVPERPASLQSKECQPKFGLTFNTSVFYRAEEEIISSKPRAQHWFNKLSEADQAIALQFFRFDGPFIEITETETYKISAVYINNIDYSLSRVPFDDFMRVIYPGYENMEPDD